MKALSIRQPWAELILQGRKTIELRTWRTDYRGRIAIHAAQTVDGAACGAHGLDSASLSRGALVGTVEIAGLTSMDSVTWDALREQHLGDAAFQPGLLGWRLVNPQRLAQPVPMPGRMSLFNVADDLFTAENVESAEKREDTASASPAPTAVKQGTAYDPQKPFELRVVACPRGEYDLALDQWPVAANGKSDAAIQTHRPRCLVTLSGDVLRAVADHVLDALRKAGYRATDLGQGRREPFRLDEETGVRLGLLFLAVRPLTRMARVEAISTAIRTMPSEEAYYWFSKCTATSTARNAQQALRILLAGE